MFAILILLYERNVFTVFVFFFFNDTATTEIYTLSLHDALPISRSRRRDRRGPPGSGLRPAREGVSLVTRPGRSEEHTSELQSPCNLVCRLLLEKKKLFLIHGSKNLRTS